MVLTPVTARIAKAIKSSKAAKLRPANNAIVANRRTVLTVPLCWSPLTTVAYLRTGCEFYVGTYCMGC